MARTPEDLTTASLQEKLRSPYDFRCLLLASSRDGRKDRAIYLGEDYTHSACFKDRYIFVEQLTSVFKSVSSVLRIFA